MNIDDFRYMWRGKQKQVLTAQQADLLTAINIRRKDKKRALLLLHGFSSTPAVYRQFLPSLTMYDAVVCPVLPGHADSIATFAKAKASDWLTTAEQSCQALCEDYQAVDVMGISLGGLLACHLSKQFTLNHLYLLAPALALQLNISRALRLARALKHLGFKSLRNRAGNLHSNQHDELAYRQLPLTTIIEILTLVKNFQFVPPDCPVDLFLGEFDRVVDSPRVAQYFADLPHTQVHWLKNSAHVLPLDGDIDTIINHVRHNWQPGNKQ